MKKVYNGLKAEVVNFGSFEVVTVSSLPPGCFRVVANYEAEETGKCQNPDTTLSRVFFGNRPPWMN